MSEITEQRALTDLALTARDQLADDIKGLISKFEAYSGLVVREVQIKREPGRMTVGYPVMQGGVERVFITAVLEN